MNTGTLSGIETATTQVSAGRGAIKRATIDLNAWERIH